MIFSTTSLITDEVWANDVVDEVKKSNATCVEDDAGVVHAGYQANGLVLTECLETFILASVPVAKMIEYMMPAVRTCREVERPIGCLSCIGRM